MDEKEQRKADAKLILEGKEAVVSRVVDVINELFHNDKNAASNLKWFSSQLIAAERSELHPKTVSLSEAPLRAYIRQLLKEEMAQSMANAMALHAQQMDGKIKELKKLEKKTWRKR
jgi:hypothetical protein